MKIGGLPIVRLQAQEAPAAGAGFLDAEVLPGRGMMLLQARALLPGRGEIEVFAAPSAEEAARQLAGGAEDFAGNRSFAFGGAILLPYANRIRGHAMPGRRIAVDLDGQGATLPANWSGKAPGAPPYAMHGLMLDVLFSEFRRLDANRVEARWLAGDFGGRWPSQAEVSVAWTLTARTLGLEVRVVNVGHESLPLGVGWHPYFRLPSGDRRQARLRIPARARLEVGDYDQVLPTGAVLPASGAYDFRDKNGAPLGETYLDDCFVDLLREGPTLNLEITDPAAGYGVRLSSTCPQVKAVQVYAPPDQAFVVVEPQFNWPDPFSPLWPAGTDVGMARLAPGETAIYEVRTELFGEAMS